MAGRKPRAPRTRAHLLAIQRKLVRKGATKDAMIAAVQEQYPEIIRSEMQDIIYLGLKSIANGNCNLKLGVAAGVQMELFPGYDVPRTITLQIADAAGQMEPVTKALDATTKAEARQYLADHTKPPKQSRKVKDIKRLLDYIGDSGEDDWTLKRCWKAAHDDAADL